MLARIPFLIPLGGLLAAIGLMASGAGIATFVVIALSALFIFIYSRGRPGMTLGEKLSRKSQYRPIWLSLLFVGLGMGVIAYHNESKPDFDVAQPSHRLSGTIEEIATMEWGDRMLVKVDCFDNGNGFYASPFRLMVYGGVTDFIPGDIISFPDDIEPYGESLYEDSPYEKYLIRRGILGNVMADRRMLKKEGEEKNIIPPSYLVREQFAELLATTDLSDHSCTILKMLLLGDRTDCSVELRNQFTYSGIAHIFALSGLHVGIILGIILLILQPFNLVLPSKVRYIIAIPAIWLYCYIVGFPVSTVRAAIMVTFMLVAIVAERGDSSLNSLCAAVFFILLSAPEAIADAGFQLSVFSVLCLIAYGDALYSIDIRTNPVLYKVSAMMLTMLVATFGTWAIVAWHFGTFAPGFAISNMIVLPLLPIYLVISLIYLLTSACGHPLEVLGWIVDLGSDGVMSLTNWLGGNEENVVHISPSPVTVVLWTAGIIILGFYLSSRKYNEARMANPHTARKKHKMAMGVSLTLMGAGIIALPFYTKAEPTLRYMVSSSQFGVRLKMMDEKGMTKRIDLPNGRAQEWTFCKHKFAYIDCNNFSHRSRKPYSVPDSLHKLRYDYVIVGDGYKGNLNDLLRYMDCKVILECRRDSYDGPSFEYSYKLMRDSLNDMGDYRRLPRPFTLQQDEVYVLSLPASLNESNSSRKIESGSTK